MGLKDKSVLETKEELDQEALKSVLLMKEPKRVRIRKKSETTELKNNLRFLTLHTVAISFYQNGEIEEEHLKFYLDEIKKITESTYKEDTLRLHLRSSPYFLVHKDKSYREKGGKPNIYKIRSFTTDEIISSAQDNTIKFVMGQLAKFAEEHSSDLDNSYLFFLDQYLLVYNNFVKFMNSKYSLSLEPCPWDSKQVLDMFSPEFGVKGLGSVFSGISAREIKRWLRG